MGIDSGHIERMLGVSFTSKALLVEAITHTSFSNENHTDDGDNERLEFLGDAVLGLIISDHLFRTFGDRAEGNLAKMKSVLVSDVTLAEIAASLSLGSVLRLGVGEERTGGRDRPAILENALEALIGALYLDGGFAAAQAFVMRVFSAKLAALAGDTITADFKTALQERVQQQLKITPKYAVVAEAGPEHKKNFSVEVSIDGKVYGRGSGGSKKTAEQDAARDALTHFRE